MLRCLCVKQKILNSKLNTKLAKCKEKHANETRLTRKCEWAWVQLWVAVWVPVWVWMRACLAKFSNCFKSDAIQSPRRSDLTYIIQFVSLQLVYLISSATKWFPKWGVFWLWPFWPPWSARVCTVCVKSKAAPDTVNSLCRLCHQVLSVRICQQSQVWREVWGWWQPAFGLCPHCPAAFPADLLTRTQCHRLHEEDHRWR